MSDNESKQSSMSDNASADHRRDKDEAVVGGGVVMDNASGNGGNKAKRNEVNMNADSIVDDRNEGDGNNQHADHRRDKDEAVVGGGVVMDMDEVVVRVDDVPTNERRGSFLHYVLFDYTKIYLRQ